MRDPFRPNSDRQLVREAQIGFMVICSLTALLIYVAWFRLSGRFDRVPDAMLKAPVAKHVTPESLKAPAPSPLPQPYAPAVESIVSANPKTAPTLNRDIGLVSGKSTQAPPATQTPIASRIGSAFNPAPPLKLAKTVKAQAGTFKPNQFASPLKDSFVPCPDTKPGAKEFMTPSAKKPSAKKPPAKKPSENRPSAKQPKKQFSLPNVRKPTAFTPIPAPAPGLNAPPTQAPPLATKSNSSFQPTSTASPAPPAFPKASNNSSPPLDRPTPIADDDFLLPMDQPTALPKLNPPLQLKSTRAPKANTAPEQKPTGGKAIAVKHVSFETESPTATAASKDTTHTVIDGDNFWSIAQKHYNDGRYFHALYEFNRHAVDDYENLQPGTILQLPAIENLRSRFPKLCPAIESDIQSEVEQPTVTPEARVRDLKTTGIKLQTYDTVAGDTLYDIARQKLGQASRYVDILNLNKRRLQPGIDQLSPLPEGVQLFLPTVQ